MQSTLLFGLFFFLGFIYIRHRTDEWESSDLLTATDPFSEAVYGNQVSSQAVNTVGAAASSTDAHVHTCIMLCIYILYYVGISAKGAFVTTTKQHGNYIKHSVTLHKTSCIYIYIYIIENELFTTTVNEERQHVDQVGCRTFFSGLIIMFVSGISLSVLPFTALVFVDSNSCISVTIQN